MKTAIESLTRPSRTDVVVWAVIVAFASLFLLYTCPTSLRSALRGLGAGGSAAVQSINTFGQAPAGIHEALAE